MITAIRTPAITRTREINVTVSLDEFDPAAIAEHLRGLGYQVDGAFSRQMLDALGESKTRRRTNDDDDDPEYENGLWISESELDRIETLALCGQQDVARTRLVELVRASREGSRL